MYSIFYLKGGLLLPNIFLIQRQAKLGCMHGCKTDRARGKDTAILEFIPFPVKDD